MTQVSESLTFQAENWSIATAILFVIVIFALALWGCARMSWRRSSILLESLRCLIAILIAATLLQPEWLRTFKPDSLPVVALLHDVSGSMETEDAVSSTPGASQAIETLSRVEMARGLVAHEKWESVSHRFQVLAQPFSSLENPPVEGTDLHHALEQIAEQQPNLAAVVLISDGDWNAGPPPAAAATRLRMRNVPVLAVPVGAETRQADIEVTGFDVPTFAVAGKPLRIPFSLESTLPRDEILTLEMSVVSDATGAEELITQQVRLPAMGRVQDAMLWRPQAAGTVRLRLKAPPVATEKNTSNNQLEAPVEVRKEQLRVLLIESYPRWEYRYLRNALERDPGVKVEALLFHPELAKTGGGRGYLAAFPREEDLTSYDVIFLGDVGLSNSQLTAAQCSILHKLVRDQAAGLVFLPGLRGALATLLETELEELVPVVWDLGQPRGFGSETPGRFVLTEAGARSLLTKLEDTDEASSRVWSTLPGFQWHAPALRAKAGSEVLAAHSTETNEHGRIPLIVTKTYGSGKILYMGADGAWRWRRGVEDRYHYRFWGQVVRWMAYQRNMARGEKIRLFYAPDRPRTGGSVTLNANVIAMSGEPLKEGIVVAQIFAPSGKTTSLRLTAAGEEAWGLFAGTFTPNEPGEHQIRLTSADAGESLDSTLSVQGTAREKRGQPVRLDVLAEIAQLTRGELLAAPDLEAIVRAVQNLPEPDLLQQRVLIWAHPAWAALIIFLLGLFWAGRKMVGVF